jgi:predicted SprT family Zn-dependent metalloprotease
MDTTRQNQIVQKVRELADKAAKLYNITMPWIHVRFYLFGSTVARATVLKGLAVIDFNIDMLESDFDFEATNTEAVPHEVAHIVCMVHPSFGNDHDEGWKKVCVELGGSGILELVTHKTSVCYEYISTEGIVVHTCRAIYKRVQTGENFKVHDLLGGGLVTKDCKASVLLHMNDKVFRLDTK